MTLIIKGEGVEWVDPETGIKHLVRFADKGNPYAETHSHFHLHPKTGAPIKNIMGKWPMEGAAHKVAFDIMKRFPGTDLAKALKVAKDLFNEAARQFNTNHRDAKHLVPIPFDEDGKLHPEWAQNNYGNWIGAGKHSDDEIPTRDNDGRLITLYHNMGAHPTKGRFPESAPLPFKKYLKKLLDAVGVQSSYGAGNQLHMEPQHFMITTDGDSNHRRHTSNPKGKGRREEPFSQAVRNTGERKSVSLSLNHVLAALPENAYRTFDTQQGRTSGKLVDTFRTRLGLDETEAQQLARTPASGLFRPYDSYTKGSQGKEAPLRKLMLSLQDRLMQSGVDEADIKGLQEQYVQDHQTNMNNSQFRALSRTMAILQLSKDRLKDYKPVNVSSNRNASLLYNHSRDLYHDGQEPEAHKEAGYDTSGPIIPVDDTPRTPVMPAHVNYGGYAPVEGAGSMPIQDIVRPTPPKIGLPPTRPMVGVAPTYGRAPLGVNVPVMTSSDSLFDIMERLQIAEAEMDGIFTKSDDIGGLAQNHNLSQQDILAIQHGVGNWETLAKALSIPYAVVRAVKVASR